MVLNYPRGSFRTPITVHWPVCLFVLILSHSLPGFSDEAQAVLRINKIVKADSYSKALGISSEPYVEKSSEI